MLAQVTNDKNKIRGPVFSFKTREQLKAWSPSEDFEEIKNKKQNEIRVVIGTYEE